MMKKIVYIFSWFVLMSYSAIAFKFDILGYSVSYNPPIEREIITTTTTTLYSPYVTALGSQNNANIPTKGININLNSDGTLRPSNKLTEFDDDVIFLNSIPEVTTALRQLKFNEIGVVDLDTGKKYGVIILDGKIDAVYKGYSNPNVIMSGSYSRIKTLIQQGKTDGIMKNVHMPLWLKIKLFFMRIF